MYIGYGSEMCFWIGCKFFGQDDIIGQYQFVIVFFGICQDYVGGVDQVFFVEVFVDFDVLCE